MPSLAATPRLAVTMPRVGAVVADGGVADVEAERFGLALAASSAHAGEEPGELLAAEAGREAAARFGRLGEQCGDGAQRLVAVLMSLRVVELS